MKIYNKYGYHVLDRTLLLVVSTWEGDVDSLSSNMLKGIARLIAAYGENLKDDQFVDRLSKVSVREIIRTAKDRHAGTQGYAEAVLLQYNKRLKYPLRWDSLSKNLEKKAAPSSEEAPAYVEEDGFVVDPVTGEIIQEPEDDDDDFYGDEEGVPDNVGALPSPGLLDNLALRQP